ncbi:MAG TPA: cytochrome c [Lysobacter sp.]
MNPIRKTVLAIAVVAIVAVGGVAASLYSGAYNVAADDPHTRPVHALLETARERSIAARARQLQAPADLGDPARIRQGAGNYEAMCTGCHLSPGSGPTELSKGLYPAPPDLTRTTVPVDEAFWVIKHGIKASGMPAWGRSMDDDYIWNMAAFLQQLPKLDKAAYVALVASSGGHSHGGGETGGHSHAGDEGDHASGADEGRGDATTDQHRHDRTPASGKKHAHADGKQHTHAPAAAEADAPRRAPAAEPVDNGHDHQH